MPVTFTAHKITHRLKTVGKTLNFVSLLLLVLLLSSSAFAAGLLGLDSVSFFQNSTYRPTQSYMFTVGPQFEARGAYVEGKLDLRAMGFTHDATSMTLESKNAYMATSALWTRRHQLTLGRRVYDWSTFDDLWSYGLWSPRYTWDPLRPEQVGLTGVFYAHQSSVWRILAFASPVSVPERGYPQQNVDGKVTSPSPYALPMYEAAALLNNTVPIRYNVKTPSYGQVLLRPAAAIGFKYGREYGGWASATYGYMPVHQIDLAIDASLQLQNNTRLDVDIYPRFPMHHLLTVETGYKHKMWALWTSVSADQPTLTYKNPNWIANKTGPALLTAAGGELKWQEGLKLHASYLMVLEPNHGIDGPSLVGDVNLSLPSRFLYRKALQTGGKWDRGSPTSYAFKWTYDIDNLSNLFSTDITYRPRWKAKIYRFENWAFNFGADMIASTTKKGAIGNYAGDDRVRTGVSYAF